MVRPTKYKPEYAKQVYKLCLLRATDKDLADYFEVQETTINNWKIRHLKFLESIKRGKKQADAEVAEKLFQRACGYKHPEDKIFCTNGVVTTVKTTKHYPPDTAAAFIWLKNRAGWTDKQEVVVDDRTEGEKLEISDIKKRLEGLEDAGTGLATD